MARQTFYVVTHGGQWAVSHNDHRTAHATQAQAIRSAVDRAHALGRQGHDAEVRVQGANGQWRTEWTYGHDPYPPKG